MTFIIPQPNYTQTPNVFFDEIMQTLNEGEMRVLLIIMRQTFGWHKLEDWISLKLLSEKTGYDRRSVCRILARLIEKNLVYKRIEGPMGSQKCYYSLVTEPVEKEQRDLTDGVETQEEMNEFQKSYTSDRRVTPPVTGGSPPPVTGGSPTKETNTKETIQKKQQQQAAVSAAAVSDSFYKELNDIDIPIADKVEITNTYSIEQVLHAIEWSKTQKSFSKGLAAALKWACKNEPEIPISKEDVVEKNKAYAMKYKNARSGNAKVEVLNSSVEIDTGCPYTFFSLRYDEKGFMDQFTNSLRKNNFMILE